MEPGNQINWEPFFGPAGGFLSIEDFDDDERGYKLEVAGSVVALRDAVLAGEPIPEPLKACLRHKRNNLLPWRLVDDLLTWAEEDPGQATEALAGLFSENTDPLDGLAAFFDHFPKTVTPGRGSRLAAGSFFLMGRDAERYPIYRQAVVRRVRKLAGWGSVADDELSEYRDALAMFESFRQSAASSGLPIESALHAQGVLYAIAQWEPDERWSAELRDSVTTLRREQGMLEPLSLTKAVAEYDRASSQDRLEAATEQRNAFVASFPVTAWSEMQVERYALGLDASKEGVSYALEWGTEDCGSISGGSANKHLLYFSSARDAFKFEAKYDNHESAWAAIRSGVEELLEQAAHDDFAAIDEIDALWAAPAVRLKLAWLYFPDKLLPVYSDNHLDFWCSIFGIDPANRDRVAKNRLLFTTLTAMPEFEGWSSLEIMHFLYSWTDPNPGHTIVKIAPGRHASLWGDCLSNGRIRMGFDGTADLAQFESDDELRTHYAALNTDDSKSNVTKTARMLRTFRDLEPGDIVVANDGTKKVVGIGRVTGGYRFEPDLTEYRHIVEVDWFDTEPRDVDFSSAWMPSLVPIKPDDYHRILRASKSPIEAVVPLPSVPPLHLEAEKLLDRSGQVIFYGPPGTGKTYAARRHAAWLLGGGSGKTEAARAFGEQPELAKIETPFLQAPQTDARPSWLVVANPSYWSFDQLFERGSEEYDYGRLKRNFDEVQPGDEVFGYEATPVKRIVARARASRALYTAGTGKQHIDIEPVDRPTKQLTWDTLKDDPVLGASEPLAQRMQGTLFRLEPHEASRLRVLAGFDGADEAVGTGVPQLTRVTFHPTYAYEDFIEGYKPTESGAGGLELAMKDGVFKRVCRAAAADPEQNYVLMIDEINRGNVPKIFGELITLIEKDKRGMSLTLPQSGEPFHVPENVHIIATMNTADRSIHILDAALRRRFAFVELMPEPAILTARIGPLPLDEFLRELNSRIRERVGREKQVGHAVLMKGGAPIETAPEFALSFKYELLPLLQEYTYGNYNDLAELLGPEVVDEANEMPNAEILEDPERLVEALAKHLELG